MQKKFIFFILMLAVLFQPVFSQTHNESWYRNYFKEHIEELDPIEGIYSVNSHIVFKHGITEENRYTDMVAIIKEGYCFKKYHLDGRVTDASTQFRRIGETSAYDYTVKYDCCAETANGRIYIESLFGFEYMVTMPTSVIRAVLKSEYAHLFKVTSEYRYIKDYPTRSMYEDAFTAVQKKKEEELKPNNWSGTGWAIESGHLVTNYHVIDGARTISIKGIGGDLNMGYSAEVVATDKTNDIAVLKITDSQFKGFGTIPYAVSSRIADKGEGIFVLGYPMTQVLGNEVKYTAGEINSRTGFQGDVATYQISAPVTHGNSGGPMFDNRGNVIGIVNSGITDKEIAENVGYAIKISYLKILIESAGLNITLPQNNTIANLSKQEKIKKVEKFVYYIECSK